MGVGEWPPDYEPNVPPVEDRYQFVTTMSVRVTDRPVDLTDRLLQALNLPPKTVLKVTLMAVKCGGVGGVCGPGGRGRKRRGADMASR